MSSHVPLALKNRRLLQGPDEPKWACSSCGRSDNYARRVSCFCKKPAPPDVVKRAVAEHNKLAKKPATRGAPPASVANSPWRTRGEYAKSLAKRLADLEASREADLAKAAEQGKRDQIKELRQKVSEAQQPLLQLLIPEVGTQPEFVGGRKGDSPMVREDQREERNARCFLRPGNEAP